MARVLLDSTVLIDALRGLPAVDRIRALKRHGDEPWICVISVEEIWRGLREGEEPGTRKFMRGFRLAPLGQTEGERAGHWRQRFSRQGIQLHQADCFIAAAALRIDARLATGNPSHFPMPELTVEDWPPGL